MVLGQIRHSLSDSRLPVLITAKFLSWRLQFIYYMAKDKKLLINKTGGSHSSMLITRFADGKRPHQEPIREARPGDGNSLKQP